MHCVAAVACLSAARINIRSNDKEESYKIYYTEQKKKRAEFLIIQPIFIVRKQILGTIYHRQKPSG